MLARVINTEKGIDIPIQNHLSGEISAITSDFIAKTAFIKNNNAKQHIEAIIFVVLVCGCFISL